MLKKVKGLTGSNEEIIVLGILLEFSLLTLLLVTGINRGSCLLEIVFWLPFAIYLLTIWRVSRTEEAAAPRQILAIILLFALVFHATLLFSSFPLSNDVYRYYWNGKVLNQGLNPYLYSPNDDQLRFLRDTSWERGLNRDVHTMYPPLAQIVFAIAYLVSPDILTLRLFSVMLNLLATYILILVLKELGHDVRYSIIYAWSPLGVIEFANSGHIDSLAVLLVLVSFLAFLKGRMTLSATTMALGVLSKIYPLLFASLFFPRWRKKGVLIFAGVITAFYLPFLGAGRRLFSGGSHFVSKGLFNGSLFPLLFGSLGTVMGRLDALRATKVLVLIIFICLLAYLYTRLRQEKENDRLHLRYSFWLTGSFLLLSPTVHPWYLTWVLPFLCFFRSPGWLLFSGTVILARSVYIGYEATGVWKEIGWIRLCEYIPPYLLMFYEFGDRIKSGGRVEKSTDHFFQSAHPRSGQDQVGPGPHLGRGSRFIS